MQLEALLDDLKSYDGICNKKDIQAIGRALAQGFSHDDYPNGDDSAVIKSADGYDLFAAEGFLSDFVAKDPWFAGWCGLMVNISDIAAMGGRPTAVTNVLWGQSEQQTQQILDGMVAASHAFQVPIVGGHTNLKASSSQLAVSILGKAKKLLSSFTAQAGHDLVAAIDLRGDYRKPFLNWNAATTAPAKRLRGDIELLPIVAEQELAVAAKDISQPGILGACTMMLECSQVGATIQLDAIPKPKASSWADWLRAFPSFGYLFTTPADRLEKLIALFEERDIAIAKIGEIISEPKLNVCYGTEKKEFWNIEREVLTGMTTNTCAMNQVTVPRIKHA